MKLKDAIRTMLFKDKVQYFHQLYTEWGEKLDPDHVLEEYPRPQLRRDNYTILNGYWSYCITTGPYQPGQSDGRILVPFSPEAALSGVNRQLQPGEFLCYERPLIIEEKPEGKRCILHFGAVDQGCELWINGVRITEHLGGYLPFSVDITDRIQEGGNLLAVRVWDVSDSSYHSRGKQKLKRGGMFYTAQSGIWQTVWLEWVPELYITALAITPLYDASSVRIRIHMNTEIGDIGSSEVFSEEPSKKQQERGQKLRSEEDTALKDEGAMVYRVDIYENQTRILTYSSVLPEFTVRLKNFISWSPENPFLYQMVIWAGEDQVNSYFGMRAIEIQVDPEGMPRIYLNHKPYFQRGLLDQGYWPDGLYTAPSDEAMIYDIKQAKTLGFNMLRKHCKLEPQRWYYHCDRLGMLVWQDMVNGGEKYNMLLVGYLPTLFPGFASRIKDHHYRRLGRGNEDGRREWLAECEATVRLLYNHPSIVVWVPFNEGWGQFDALKVKALVRQLDPSRLIDHASGWFDQKGGDFDSIHNYFHPLSLKLKKQATVLSEFGGYACYITEHSYSFTIYGYRIYVTKEAFDQAYQKLMREDLANLRKKGLSAAVYTQLTDVEDEVNGLLTYDRKLCKVTPLDSLEE